MSSEIESGIRSTNHNQLCCSNLNSTIAAIETEIVEKVSRTTRWNKKTTELSMKGLDQDSHMVT